MLELTRQKQIAWRQIFIINETIPEVYQLRLKTTTGAIFFLTYLTSVVFHMLNICDPLHTQSSLFLLYHTYHTPLS